MIKNGFRWLVRRFEIRINCECWPGMSFVTGIPWNSDFFTYSKISFRQHYVTPGSMLIPGVDSLSNLRKSWEKKSRNENRHCTILFIKCFLQTQVSNLICLSLEKKSKSFQLWRKFGFKERLLIEKSWEFENMETEIFFSIQRWKSAWVWTKASKTTIT